MIEKKDVIARFRVKTKACEECQKVIDSPCIKHVVEWNTILDEMEE